MSFLQSANTPPQFVLVDDAIEDLRLMEFVLKEVFPTAEIYSFQSGEELTSFWHKSRGHFDRISGMLIDYNMPGSMSAEEILALVETSSPKNFPVYVFSGAALPSQRREMIQMGAQDFLEKPVDLFDLQALIQTLFSPGLSSSSAS